MRNQTAWQYNPIGSYGCYFACLCHMAELEAGQTLKDWQVIWTFNEALTAGYLECSAEKTAFILRPDKIAQLAYYNLTHDAERTFSYVGRYEKTEHDGEIQMWQDVNPTYAIKKYRTNAGPSHFVMDDYNPNPSLNLLELVGKRFYRIFR